MTHTRPPSGLFDRRLRLVRVSVSTPPCDERIFSHSGKGSFLGEERIFPHRGKGSSLIAERFATSNKGSQKYPEFADRIDNFPAWLMQLTKNFCISLIKKRAKQATGVDDIELVSALGAIDRDSAAETPVEWLLSEEELAQMDEAHLDAKLPVSRGRSMVVGRWWADSWSGLK